MRDYKWLNVLAKQIDGKTYIFCSCRDIHDPYSMGNTWKGNRSMGLEAKKTEITNRCKLSHNPQTRCLDLHEFQTVANIECTDSRECLRLCRLVTVIFKRFYINDFGGVAIPRFPLDKIEISIKYILKHCMRMKDKTIVEVLGMFDRQFRSQDQIHDGEVYIIDNLETTKVGFSHDAEQRFENLKRNGELNEDATLYKVYSTWDAEGVEASAHALLDEWKTQNPIKTYARNLQYGLLDEHFSCPANSADAIIYSNLSGYFNEL